MTRKPSFSRLFRGDEVAAPNGAVVRPDAACTGVHSGIWTPNLNPIHLPCHASKNASLNYPTAQFHPQIRQRRLTESALAVKGPPMGLFYAVSLETLAERFYGDTFWLAMNVR